jgi:hypothetical protein
MLVDIAYRTLDAFGSFKGNSQLDIRMCLER